MSVRAAVTRALPLTFICYLVAAALATEAALPSALELARALEPYAWDDSERAALLDRALTLAPLTRVLALELLLASACSLLLGPWLHASWLFALRSPNSLRDALTGGLSFVRRNVFVSLLVFVATALLLAAIALSVWLLSAALDERARERMLLGASVLALLVLHYGHVVHDLARARSLEHGALRCVRGSLRAALSPRLQLTSVLPLLCALGLIAAAHALSLRSPDSVRALATVPLLQSAQLGRYVLRSAWLVQTLACAAALDVARVGRPKQRGQHE